jgi:hypothetical protein
MTNKSTIPSQRTFGGLLVLCLALAIADLLYHRHAHFSFESWPGFYGVLAFLGAAAVVFLASVLRPFLTGKRDTDER